MATIIQKITDSISLVRPSGDQIQAVAHGGQKLLEIKIPAMWPNDAKLDWCFREGKKISAQGQVQNLTEIPAEARAARLRVWTSAADTLLTTAILPTKSRRKIDQALPFALEDKLLGDPGDLFFVHTTNADKSLSVAATSRKQLEIWLAAFEAEDLHPEMLAPITLAIPLMKNCWNITYWGTEAWVRTGACSGFSCPAQSDQPSQILLTALAESRSLDRAPESLLVCNPPEGFDENAWANTLNLEVPVDDVHPWENISAATPPINLLQREFSPKTDKLGIANRFLPGAVMLALLLIGTLVIDGWQWWQLSNDYQNSRSEMVSILRASFPEQSKVIVDPYRQMRRNIELLGNNSAANSDNNYLNLISKVAPILTRESGSTLLGLEYRDNSLLIDLQLADYRTLESLKNELQDNKMTIDVRKASTVNDSVSARLLVRLENLGGRL